MELAHMQAPAQINFGAYAFLDLVAGELVGQVLYLHKHEAAAIRMFADIAGNENSIIQKHPADFALVRLGYINTENKFLENYQTILTGSQWIAAQQPQLVKEA